MSSKALWPAMSPWAALARPRTSLDNNWCGSSVVSSSAIKGLSHGSSCNIVLGWESGEKVSEPLDIIAKGGPVACAKESELLADAPGWKWLKPTARCRKQEASLDGQSSQASLFLHHSKMQAWTRGSMRLHEAPRGCDHAALLDKKHQRPGNI